MAARLPRNGSLSGDPSEPGGREWCGVSSCFMFIVIISHTFFISFPLQHIDIVFIRVMFFFKLMCSGTHVCCWTPIYTERRRASRSGGNTGGSIEILILLMFPTRTISLIHLVSLCHKRSIVIKKYFFKHTSPTAVMGDIFLNYHEHTHTHTHTHTHSEIHV